MRTLFAAPVVLVAVLAAHATSAVGQTSLLAEIDADRVVAISDGDFVAKTYADGILAPPERNFRDVLSVFTIGDGDIVEGSVPVSNSVTAAPEILALTADGNTAFVTERLGERPVGATTSGELPSGNRLFAVDLSNGSAPRISATAIVAANPEALSVSPDGRRVAVIGNTPDASIVSIVDYDAGRFGDVRHFDLRSVGITGSTDGPRRGVTVTNVHWHPSGRAMAININTQNRVAFLKLEGENDTLSLEPWGNTVEVGRDPFVGRFTPDGRHYLTSNWGRDFAATTLDGRIPDAPSTMSLIRVAALDDDDGIHENIQTIDTDVSAEGIAVSPDGKLVATVNMRGSVYAAGHPRHQREAGVSLITFDAQTEKLEKVGDYLFEGVLPEGGAFDRTGRHFLATVFEGHPGSDANTGSGLQVFRVTQGEKPSLEPIGRVPLPHGLHHVDLR